MRVPTRQRSGQTLNLEPIGAGGLDVNTNAVLLPPDRLRSARNCVLVDDAVARRKGSAKITRFADPAAANGSKTFGDVSKYATLAPSLATYFAYSGFGFKFACYATRTGGTAFLISQYVGGNNSGPLTVWLTSGGTLNVQVFWDGGGSTTLTTAALTDGAKVTGLLIYNSVTGTLTLYIDGESAATATPGTGKRPVQTGFTWYVAVQNNITLGLVGPWAGAIGPLVAFGFRGIDITAGTDGGLLRELRRGTFQDWPNPAARMVLWHYAMAEASGTSMVDSSRFKNHGTYVGGPSNSARIVYPAANGNALFSLRKAALGALSDASVNIAALGGAAYYQQTSGGVS